MQRESGTRVPKIHSKTKPQPLQNIHPSYKNSNIVYSVPSCTVHIFPRLLCHSLHGNLKSVLLGCREASGEFTRISRSAAQASLCACGLPHHLTPLHPTHPGTVCYLDSPGSSCGQGSWVSLSARTTYLGKTHGGSVQLPLGSCLASVPRTQRKASFLWWEDEWTRWEMHQREGEYSRELSGIVCLGGCPRIMVFGVSSLALTQSQVQCYSPFSSFRFPAALEPAPFPLRSRRHVLGLLRTSWHKESRNPVWCCLCGAIG